MYPRTKITEGAKLFIKKLIFHTALVLKPSLFLLKKVLKGKFNNQHYSFQKPEILTEERKVVDVFQELYQAWIL